MHWAQRQRGESKAPAWLGSGDQWGQAEQGGTHHTPSLGFIAGDSLELRESNPAEQGQMVTAAPGRNAQKYHTGSPHVHTGSIPELV